MKKLLTPIQEELIADHYFNLHWSYEALSIKFDATLSQIDFAVEKFRSEHNVKRITQSQAIEKARVDEVNLKVTAKESINDYRGVLTIPSLINFDEVIFRSKV